MRNMKIFLAILSLLLVVGACRGTKNRFSDSDITGAVHNKLAADPTIPAADIDVRTHDGVVTLGGKVIGQSTADKAMQIARSVPGVRAVNSKMEVKTFVANRDTVNDMVETGDRTVGEEDRRSEPGAPYDAGGSATDASITAQVKDRLQRDEVTQALNIEVNTDNRVVKLRGLVNMKDEATRAVQLAESVPDVKRVDSDLKVANR